MTNDSEKSDLCEVATKPANKAAYAAAESAERRRRAKGNTIEHHTRRTQSRASVTPGLERVRERAKQREKSRFTALLHHVNVDLLTAAFSWLKREAAAGVDGLTWVQYEQDLGGNIVDLHSRLHRGAYRAKLSLRRFIPKEDGRQRPLGIAALEDKIVQRAVVEVLNAIYEQDFLGFSYGYRPGRSQHDALDALAFGIGRMKVNWILDCDIQSFFDAISHEWMIRFVEHRVRDPRIVRLIRQWLKAGVMEEGKWVASETGTPQGAVISPLLANLYLHYAFDLWAQQWRGRRTDGQVVLVRFADDIVVGFEHEADARSFQAQMRERLERFALSLHPHKTRLLEFGRFANERRARRGLRKAETFNFLGFTHICQRSRDGQFQLGRKTRRERSRGKLQTLKVELLRRRHEPIPQQGRWLAQVMRGYFAFYAVPTNYRSLQTFHHLVIALWHRALRRRSQRDHISWERVRKLAAAFLPRPKILHPWPIARFIVTHPRWEPSARIGPARICAGGIQ